MLQHCYKSNIRVSELFKDISSFYEENSIFGIVRHYLRCSKCVLMLNVHIVPEIKTAFDKALKRNL